jgi:pantoate--beta-alanine ligase
LKLFTTKREIANFLADQKKTEKKIGFVPTMGALHDGHLSLIKSSKDLTNLTVCSIFVNPTQFNDPKDLEKYPRPVDDDIEKLKKAGCDVLFMPDVKEMYAEGESWHIDLGDLENVLEGKFRPGHYQGVTQIVKKLFDIINPDIAFFGQKDYQQYLVIDAMVRKFAMPVELNMCPIVREKDGLAMSSRNVRLSKKEREQALALSRALEITQKNFQDKTIDELETEAKEFLEKSDGIKLEYFEIADGETLHSTTSRDSKRIVALVAAFVGNTRLIDNLILK